MRPNLVVNDDDGDDVMTGPDEVVWSYPKPNHKFSYSPDRTRLLLLLGGLKWAARPVLRLLKGLLSFGLKKRRCV